MRSTSNLAEFAARLRGVMRAFANEAEPALPDLPSFNQLALELFALQFWQNAPYRQFCVGRHAWPDNVRHWTGIPAVPTTAFKECELSCLPVEERARVFHSSGTTGQQRSRHFHSPASLEVYEASLLGWFDAHVCMADGKWQMADGGSAGIWQMAEGRSSVADGQWQRGVGATPSGREGRQIAKSQWPMANGPGGRWQAAILTPAPADAPHSSLVHMFETIRRKLGADESVFVGRMAEDGGWRVDLEAALQLLRKVSVAGQPFLMLGTAFSFVHLLDCLAERGLRFALPQGSCALETGGYKGRSRALPKKALHALISQQLGIPHDRIICEYGMSELSSQAYDCVIASARTRHHAARCFHFPPWARLQIISPETGCEVDDGETGLIRIFDLANVWSVTAIQTEDLGVRCGDGFALAGRSVRAEPRGCSLMTV